MLPILTLGRFSFQTPGVLLAIGLWIGLLQAESYAKKENENTRILGNLSSIMIISGIIGSRLAYVFENFPIFLKDPLSIISLSINMFDYKMGILVAVFAGFIYANRAGLAFWRTLDLFTPAFAIFSIAIGAAHFASGNLYGTPAYLPWSIFLYNDWRHPVQLYEIIAAAIIALVVWPRSNNGKLASGARFLVFIILTACAQILLETFRNNSTFIINGLRLFQLAYWLGLAVSLGLLYSRLSQAVQIQSDDSEVFHGSKQ